ENESSDSLDIFSLSNEKVTCHLPKIRKKKKRNCQYRYADPDGRMDDGVIPTLWGAKRVTLKDEDMSVDKISRIFQVLKFILFLS
ncbi:hypothetical protein LDENG_00220530, partial [Lucifuga dentata]